MENQISSGKNYTRFTRGQGAINQSIALAINHLFIHEPSSELKARLY